MGWARVMVCLHVAREITVEFRSRGLARHVMAGAQRTPGLATGNVTSITRLHGQAASRRPARRWLLLPEAQTPMRDRSTRIFEKLRRALWASGVSWQRCPHRHVRELQPQHARPNI